MKTRRYLEPTSEWYKPRSGDITWRRHPIVLVPKLVLPTLYGLSWIILAGGSYLSGATGRFAMMTLLMIGMIPTTFWIFYHIDDWQDEMYVLSRREDAIIYQSRHPFSYETGKRMGRKYIGFTTATLGITKESGDRTWSFGSFFYWLFGCGYVEVFGPSARIALNMADVFDPAEKKRVLDKWREEKEQ